MKGRAVSGMRQWILEPIFHFVICMIQSVPINQEQNKIEKKRKEKKDNRCRLAHRYRKEIRRLAQRRLRRCQRENRVMGQVCLNETILLQPCSNGWNWVNDRRTISVAWRGRLGLGHQSKWVFNWQRNVTARDTRCRGCRHSSGFFLAARASSASDKTSVVCNELDALFPLIDTEEHR